MIYKETFAWGRRWKTADPLNDPTPTLTKKVMNLLYELFFRNRIKIMPVTAHIPINVTKPIPAVQTKSKMFPYTAPINLHIEFWKWNPPIKFDGLFLVSNDVVCSSLVTNRLHNSSKFLKDAAEEFPFSAIMIISYIVWKVKF